MSTERSDADRRRMAVLREGFEIEAALRAGVDRLRAESFARGEAVVVEIDGKVLLEGPEGHYRPAPLDRALTWDDLRFDDSSARAHDLAVQDVPCPSD